MDRAAGNTQPLAGASVSGRLATHVAALPSEAIPESARRAARLFLLDTLAVAWAGSAAPGCAQTLAVMQDEAGPGQSSVWGFGTKLPATAAAFVNGMTAAALDYDCLGRDAPVHVNISVIPAALAVAELEHCSGAQFIDAVVIASDVLARMAVSSRPPHRGFHYTSTFGVFGATVAACRLFGLDALTTRHALGLAYVQACGTQQTNIEPSLAKRMLSGFAARAGVLSARLARQGITAPADVFEGPFGLYALYQAGDPQPMLEALGSRFDNHRLSIKKYPSCGCNHTSIEGVLQLVREHRLKPDDVQSITITVSPYIDTIVGMPYDPRQDPQVAAQFSIRYSAACMLVRHKLGLAEIQPEAAFDPEINRHVHKVHVVVDPTRSGDRGPVDVEMVTTSGQRFACTVAHVPGSDESPLSPAEIDGKFDECFRLGAHPLDTDGIARLRARVEGLAQVPDMAHFFDGLSG
jgi:2-methylcitrate dehydratase PrpD